MRADAQHKRNHTEPTRSYCQHFGPLQLGRSEASDPHTLQTTARHRSARAHRYRSHYSFGDHVTLFGQNHGLVNRVPLVYRHDRLV